MKAGKIILFVIAAVLIFFGVIFLLSISANGDMSLLWYAVAFLLIAFLLIFFAARMKKSSEEAANVTLNIDLPGGVTMDTIKCKSCGAPLSENDIKMVNGAPMVTCPNCGTSYQLTEEPKW
ncbi:MAG: Asp23/Gls24 family envelope stress response protein [Anaerolineaceae bacterium]